MTEPTRPCGTCGMPCTPGEYHPYAACLMFKACHNSEVVRANLEAVHGKPVPASAAEFALRALVAAGHVTQERVDQALALPGAPAQPVVPVVPAGYALVPVEPTPEMLSVMWVNKNSSLSEAYNSLSEAYSAMLAASPQPVVAREPLTDSQAQAGAVPLTDEQIEALPLWKRFVGLWPETRREIVRTIEHHHGITGGQHGAE